MPQRRNRKSQQRSRRYDNQMAFLEQRNIKTEIKSSLETEKRISELEQKKLQNLNRENRLKKNEQSPGTCGTITNICVNQHSKKKSSERAGLIKSSKK